jgi:hypothetical protein
MAFYLSRTFLNQENCYVINDLRLIYKNDAAQIDHLIITQYGLFIVESKSVYGKVTVNDKEEWSRTSSKFSSGMASPVLQAGAQGKVIKSILKENADQMLGKLLGLQKGFGSCPIFIYVAISDAGIIERKVEIPELKKADQVTPEIELKLKALKKSSSILNAFQDSNPSWSMSTQETIIVANFLLNQHKPLIKEITSIQEKTLPAQMAEVKNMIENENCPRCKTGKLLKRIAKTEFLGCSQYPKCKFTSYKNNV